MASNAPDGLSASNFTTNVPHNWCHNPLQQSHSSRWNSNIPLPQLSPQDFADANFLARNQSTTSEKLAFIYALSENDLRVGRNPSYLNLEKENVALRTRIDNLQTQLITALNLAPSITSGAQPCMTAAISTQPKPNTPPKPLKREDYPNVKYWDRQPRSKTQYAAIKVAATSDSGDDSSSEPDNDKNADLRTKGKDKIFAFLENEEGELISLSEKEALYLEVRGWWNENIDAARVPQNWSSTGATLRNQFRNDIEEKFFFLRLCSVHWKCKAIWKKNYHSWKATFRSRLKEEPDRDHCCSDDSPILKRPSNDMEHDHGAAEDESEDPRPKKKSKLAKKDKGKKPLRNATLSSKTSKNPLEGFSLDLDVLSKECDLGAGPATTSTDTSLSSSPSTTSPASTNPTPGSSTTSTSADMNSSSSSTIPDTSASPPPNFSATSADPQSTLSTSSSALVTLRARVEHLPKSVPIAKKTHTLAGYSCDPATLTVGMPDPEIWETWDPQLNALIPQAIPEVLPLVTCSKYGLIGLVQFLEHLVRDRNLDASMLDGKIGRLLEAINLVSKQTEVSPSSHTPPPNASADLVKAKPPESGATTASATSRKPRKASWKIPDVSSPKWEAARDWRQTNPSGSKVQFEEFWDALQQDKAQLQYYKERVSKRAR